jgi:signal transduction histidine kinase
VDKARSRALGGSGIGLTIAQAIVEAHGGQLTAASPGLGQGATFSFTLPLAMETKAPTSA